MLKNNVPAIQFYDQDFVDVYDRTWVWIEDLLRNGDEKNGFSGSYISYPEQKTFNQLTACMEALVLSYSNQFLDPYSMIDYFYSKQEPNGAIRSDYSVEDGTPVFTKDNPEGVSPFMFGYIEYMFYHKVGNKKRLKDIVPVLERYFTWLTENFKQENGLYAVPASACGTGNVPRDRMYYPLDFNAQLAANAFYISALGDILNDKEFSFRYKRIYFALKTRINSMMWDEETSFYYDLDKEGNQIKEKCISAYWTLLAEIPNEEKASRMIRHLHDPEQFGTENPFPCVPASSPYFSEDGNGYCGGVVPFYTYIVVKGLEKYDEFIFARECAIRHLYFILDTLHPDVDITDDVWEIYLPNREGHSICEKPEMNRRHYLQMTGLVTVVMMIENIIGLDISLPRKTVDWIMPSLEVMGIDHLSLKKNLITIISSKNDRGWEIRLESEKLYYFTIQVIDENKKKTLPIPSGKCSMLIDKL